MKLTGKCKTDFEKWYLGKYYFTGFETEDVVLNDHIFKHLDFTMQYGVYVDFFDSVGLILDVQPVLDYDEEKYTKVVYWIITVFTLGIKGEDYNDWEFKTRQEAREQAILKANEIYNDNR